MATKVEIELVGVDHMLAKLGKAIKGIDDSKALINGFIAAERIIKERVLAESYNAFNDTSEPPKRQNEEPKTKVHLRQNIASYGYLKPKETGMPGGYVKVNQAWNVITGGLPGSPHGHFIEEGTNDRYYKGAYRGKVTARPFFGKAVQISRSGVLSAMVQGLKDYIQEVVKE